MSLFKNIHNEHFRKKFKKSCKDLRFHPDTSIFTYSTIVIGKNVFINKGAYFSGEILIGDNVMIGPDVFITSSDHDYRIVGQYMNQQKRVISQKVIIDDDCWIGAKSFINRGVHIYEGALVGGASVVTKDVPPYTLFLGSPGEPVKLRYTDDELREHYRLLNRSSEEADKMISLRHLMLLSKGLGNLLYDK